jgi:hypothetical protein
MIDLFRGTYFEAMNMKGLLESNNIKVFTLNENMSNIEPWIVTAGGFNPVILKVSEEDLERAKKIVKDYESRT